MKQFYSAELGNARLRGIRYRNPDFCLTMQVTIYFAEDWSFGDAEAHDWCLVTARNSG